MERECEEYREKVIIYTEWYRRVKNAYLITYLNDELQDIYEYGIMWYKRSVREQLDLQDMADLLPEHCPWSLEELINGTVDELLEKLRF